MYQKLSAPLSSLINHLTPPHIPLGTFHKGRTCRLGIAGPKHQTIYYIYEVIKVAPAQPVKQSHSTYALRH